MHVELRHGDSTHDLFTQSLNNVFEKLLILETWWQTSRSREIKYAGRAESATCYYEITR